MTIFVFGNPDYAPDAQIFSLLPRLRADFPSLTFSLVNPNEDLPVDFRGRVVILDAVEGIEQVKLLEQGSADRIVSPPRYGVHDYDLGFQLKYLMKLGKLTGFAVIGLPMKGRVDYDSIQLILRKLVAQDIQGS